LDEFIIIPIILCYQLAAERGTYEPKRLYSLRGRVELLIDTKGISQCPVLSTLSLLISAVITVIIIVTVGRASGIRTDRSQ